MQRRTEGGRIRKRKVVKRNRTESANDAAYFRKQTTSPPTKPANFRGLCCLEDARPDLPKSEVWPRFAGQNANRSYTPINPSQMPNPRSTQPNNPARARCNSKFIIKKGRRIEGLPDIDYPFHDKTIVVTH